MEQFIKENFILLFALSILTTVIVLAVSVVYRAAKQKNFPTIPEQDVLFTEKWASGASQKNSLTKLGGASNCLSITLSRNALIIQPMFPFNLMFLPEVYDLEHAIPGSAIKKVETDGPNGQGILLEFELHGKSTRFQLSLRRSEEFVQALNTTAVAKQIT